MRWRIVLLLLAGIGLGALREFLFLNLNYQIDHVARGTPFSYAHSLFQGWTAGLDLKALLAMKWGLAAFFIAAIAALTVLLARVCSGSYRHARPIALGILGFAGLALVLHGLSRWLPGLERVSVQVLHMLQYPVPLLFVLLGWMGGGRSGQGRE